MFAIIPWAVDVPRIRWPVINWLIIIANVVVFWLQLSDFREYEAYQNPYIQDVSREESRTGSDTNTVMESKLDLTMLGITGEFMLNGWGIKGLFGYMWLHSGFLHIIGNMWFLLIFGNAICAKIGNLKYLLFYILFGISAGVAHLLFSSGIAVGASGAINGVVAMYLVLFPENDITCYFWFLLVYIRKFTVRSYWMILFWLFWDVLGAFLGSHARVGYFAHLGGFAVGFILAFVMCKKGWVIMERYEKSLLQLWEERKHPTR